MKEKEIVIRGQIRRDRERLHGSVTVMSGPVKDAAVVAEDEDGRKRRQQQDGRERPPLDKPLGGGSEPLPKRLLPRRRQEVADARVRHSDWRTLPPGGNPRQPDGVGGRYSIRPASRAAAAAALRPAMRPKVTAGP